MQHIKDTIIALRRRIAVGDHRHELEDVDALLSVALEEVRRKIQQEEMRQR